ncbi:MAG: hypothetical protein E7206_17200 [Clostridium beijerinckii]|nr:hypothetical protein [Clostridium beijerinckii]
MRIKFKYNSKAFIILTAVTFICVQLALFGVDKYYKNLYYFKESVNPKPIGEIVKGVDVIQELPKINEIDNIDILFATYANNVTSNIKVGIIQKDKKELFSTVINGKDIKDNQYYSIPINIRVDKDNMPVYLKIDGIDGTSGNALTIWSSDIQSQEKTCYINGQDSNKALNISINGNSINEKNKIIHKISYGITVTFLGIIIFLLINLIEKSVILERFYRYRYLMVMLVFLISVFVLKINFSSIKTYEMILPNNINMVKETQFGDYRSIRSDEWAVLTPLQLSQEDNGYNSESNLLGEEINISAISGGIPTKDISMIGKPFLWGYTLFGSEIGFSWYSISKLFLLLIFSYKLIYVLTKDKKLAVIGGFIISFSPGIQWWFTTNAQVTETIIYWEMIIVSLYNIFTSSINKVKYVNGVILIIGIIGFTLVLYPPFQVPLVYLGIALLVGLYLDNRKEIEFNKISLGIIGIAIIVYVAVIGITLSNMLPEIKKIMNTVYPGKRSGTGGTLAFEYMFNYLPTLFLPFKDITYSNASEISSFITLFPIPLIVYFFERKNYTSNIIRSIIVFIIGTLIFMYVGLPEFISKITLMSFVTEKRLYVIFGLAFTILIICMAKYAIRENDNNIHWVQIFIYIIISYYIYRNYVDLQGYVGKRILVLGLAVCLILVYYFIKNRNAFINLLLVITISVGVTINPINFGIGEIRETPFSLTVREINKEDPGMWITLDDIWLSKYILAQGVQTLNALNYPPMLETWERLDKNKEFLDIYNRYAHVKINLQENNKKQFELEAMDALKLNISSEEIMELGVKYIVTKQEMPKDINNINLIYTDPLDHILVYKVNRN